MTSRPNKFGPIRSLLTCLLLILLTVPALADRVPVPTPVGGGPGINSWPADQQNVLALPAPGPVLLNDFGDRRASSMANLRGDVGGDDIEVATSFYVYGTDLAVASDGTLFALNWWSADGTDGYFATVLRSTDGGTVWQEWATIHDSTPGYRIWSPEICVAEGLENRVFVVYNVDPGVGRATEVHVAWSPLDLPSGDFSNDTLIYSGSRVGQACLVTDADSFAGYYVYLTFSHDNGDGDDIHFVRSIDQGTTWESPYVLAAISVDDRGYYLPRVSIGYSGFVHVVWYLGFADDHEFDCALRYRRAPSFANGGLANWENMQSLTNHTNDVDEIYPELQASLISPNVLVANVRKQRTVDSFYFDGVDTRSSNDAALTWSGPTQIGGGLAWVGDIIHQESTGLWLLGLDLYSDWGYCSASLAAPAVWSELERFNDAPYSSGGPGIILDPTRDYRIGVLGGDYIDDGFVLYFDAEWRTDPGYPNFEPGFPIDIPFEAKSDPAVVDLDGDGDLEIVFGDIVGRINVYQHDGTPLPGWPKTTGFVLSTAPIAVGDLNGDGVMTVVAGTTTGAILAYDPQANPLPGWPYYALNNASVYPIIGSIGGPYVRAVVYGCGNRLWAADFNGDPYPDALGRGFGSRIFTHAPAVGDIDGDGRSEVVVGIDHYVYSFQMQESVTELSYYAPDPLSASVTLGDINLDGDLEIVVPLESGVLHLLNSDGSEFPGSWPVTVDDSRIVGTAIAQCLGTYEPEIAVTARSSHVSLYLEDGSEGYGWPHDTGGWNLYGSPIMGVITGSPDIIVGSRGNQAWSWSNIGTLNLGWPKAVDDHIYRTPAYGDIDLDGSTEIVFLTLDELVVVDVNNPPSETNRLWAMAGHDPERSGCADCAHDVSAAPDDDSTVITRVSMAAPHPNPIAGQTKFAFAVPVRARVELAIYDLRGRRVTSVTREELPAGRHVIEWYGRDDNGRMVASGQYLAALTVRGPGVNENLTRKITVLR